MENSNLGDVHWPPVGTGLWTRWWGYLARWLLFGVVVSLFQPINDDAGSPWQHRLVQVGLGVLFGLAAALIFTIAENKFNTPRVAWKTWLLVLLTWAIVKAAFVTAIALG
jgi:hypothetical protein